MLTVDQIQRNSQKLRELNQQIDETFRLRDRGPKESARWQEACALFHRSFDELFFPGGTALFDRVKLGDPEAIEAAVRFLEADPRHFRSGYHKEYLWRVISRQQISLEQRARLEDAALQYLQRQIGREFWYMCGAMTRIATPGFWQRVTGYLGVADRLVMKRASFLLSFSVDIHTGAKVQKQVYWAVLEEKFGGR